MNNKTFRNNKTGEVVRVIDSFENIAILENRGKEKVTNLLDTNLYTETVDTNNFLNIQNTYSSIAEQIKSIPISNIPEGEEIIQVDADRFTSITNESAIIEVSEDYERQELMKKYGIQTDVNSSLEKQNQSFSKLLDEEPVQKIDVVRDDVNQNNNSYITVPVEDPIITMFKNVKRNQEFSINLEIKNKIPRPDFIELMEDSYNYSIIEFLAQEFTDKILKNPKLIEDMITDKIKEIVYGAPELKKKSDTKDNIKEDLIKETTLTSKKRGRPKKENS